MIVQGSSRSSKEGREEVEAYSKVTLGRFEGQAHDKRSRMIVILL